VILVFYDSAVTVCNSEKQSMIHDTRVKLLNKAKERRGDYVLYWMQASQRAEYNHALEYAIRAANRLRKPLLVFFGLTGNYPNANARHYHFMLQGLRVVGEALARRGIRMLVRHVSPEVGAVQAAERASLLVTDRGYLRIQREWRRHAAKRAACPVVQVEAEVVVPVEEVSQKEEYSARTIRPKIRLLLADYMVPLEETETAFEEIDIRAAGIDISDIFDTSDIYNTYNTRNSSNNFDMGKIVKRIGAAGDVGPVEGFEGGTAEAKRRLERFLDERLDAYAEERNDPTVDALSGMSPYLHFGQISPLYVALLVRERGGPGADAYLEELIVRRELSVNFVFYNPNYANYMGVPDWARRSLEKHKGDRRPYIYSLDKLEKAKTHDPYWNAAQEEMLLTGKMHGYMRMYWGKKILEWSRTPEEAFERAVFLNDKYELDGRDANGYTGVAWCFGRHDRPWREREVFGSVRYMTADGLRRKFDADAYVQKVVALRGG
jgi:deoxyribodipyrimidine photo-lyase